MPYFKAFLISRVSNKKTIDTISKATRQTLIKNSNSQTFI